MASVDPTPSAAPTDPTVIPTRFLSVAVQRLRSEILIYLLAYAVLVVVVLLWGRELSLALQGLLYLLPLVGVAAYLVSQSRRVAQGRQPRVTVGTLFTGKQAVVVGTERPDAAADVSVSAALTRGTVKGVATPPAEAGDDSSQAAYLAELFAGLRPDQRHKVIEVAQRLRSQG